MAHAKARGLAGAVLNWRGCSGEPNRLLRAYHSGDTAEVDWVIRRLVAQRGHPIYVAGVSLGGNALLKWLGEQGASARPLVRRAAGVCAPVDLAAGGRALQTGFSAIYGRHFLTTLRTKALAKLRAHPEGSRPDAEAKIKAARTLHAFDNHFTAPVHGFRDTDDYWARASAKPWLRHIGVPTLLINPRDDPFLPPRHLPAAADLSADITAEFDHEGGHVGFVQGRFPGNIDWLPQRILRYFFPENSRFHADRT
jgi:predicted alpha/beta-fold hydrolase